MNRLTFRIDNHGNVIYCHYLEHSSNTEGVEIYINKEIQLPQEQLRKFYEVCYNKYVFRRDIITLLGDYKKCVFDNIDRNFIEDYLISSEMYEEMLVKLMDPDKEMEDINQIFSKKSINNPRDNDEIDKKIEKPKTVEEDSKNDIELKQNQLSQSNLGQNQLEQPRKKIIKKNLFKKKIIKKIPTILLVTLIAISSANLINTIVDLNDIFTRGTVAETTVSSTIKISNADKSCNDTVNRISINYNSHLDEYSRKYGISRELILAIASYNCDTQNINIYEENGKYGLFNIDENLIGSEIKAYDFSRNREESIFIVNDEYLEAHGKELKGKKNICNINNCFDNFHVGCMLLQNTLNDERLKGNILMGIMANGVGVDKVLETVKYCNNSTKIDYNSLFNQDSMIWMNYRRGGNIKYLEIVLSYIPNGSNISVRRKNGKIDSITYENDFALDYENRSRKK